MANNDSAAISLAELKEVSKSLQSQKDTIHSLYNNNIVSILESTRSCFKVAGIDYSSIENSFRSTYNELDKRYEELINVLNNSVIARYSELSAVIVQMFNTDFASRLNELLGLTKTK